MTRLETGMGVSSHVKDSVVTELSSSIQIDFFIQIQYRLQSPFPTLAPKSTISCDMSDMQYSIWWLTYKARDGYSVLLKDTAQSHPSRRRKRPDYYVHKMMDHTYIPLILPTAVLHISLTQWQRCCSSQKSNGLFDHTTFLIYIWIRLWLHQMVFFFSLSFSLSPHFLWKRKAEKRDKVRTCFNWTWKFWLF